MKKLMIAAAVAMLGIAANAAATQWYGTDDVYTQSGSRVSGDVYAFYFVDSTSVAGSETLYSYDTALAAVKKGDFSFVADNQMGFEGAAVQMYGYGDGGSSDDVFGLNNTISSYLVLLDAEDPDKATYGFITAAETVTTDAAGNINQNDGYIVFDLAGTAVKENWYTASAAPEPTSGLLLLLGVAGLALRRRRA